MRAEDLRIVFMGTPEFAVASLKALVENNMNVVGVITAPDKQAGRGRKITYSAVKEYALTQNLNILQPEKLKAPEFLEELSTLKADLQIVVAFRMLPEVVWNMPPIGTFNLHASLLPNYRGAAPINWAIINGETETGATTFFLKHEIDTGDVIDRIKEPIHPEDNVGTLYERLMNNGAQLVIDTVKKIAQGNYELKPQTLTGNEKEAPKIFTETCTIDWSEPAEKIHNLVRGLSPYPAARTTLKDKNCKIYSTEVLDKTCAENVESDNKTYLHFKCGKGSLAVKELQLEGKKRMGIEEFLRGFNL